MRIIVTGGAGFIGSHIVDAFCAKGHDVTVVDNFSSGTRSFLRSDAGLIEGDIRDAAVHEAVQSFAPHVICHQAAQIDVRKSVADPAFDADVNVVGLLGILEAARQGGQLEHVLLASSGGAIYGEQETFPATEDHPIAPASPYGLAKLVSEQYLALYERLYNIPHTNLRYANVYGPRQSPHGEAGVVAIFADRLLGGDNIRINGDGKQTRDFVFVGDVVRSNVLALEHRLRGSFNVGTGLETNVNELAEKMMTIIGVDKTPDHGPAPLGEQQRSVIDAGLLETKTGFRPSVTMDDGLAQTIAYFKDRQGAE